MKFTKKKNCDTKILIFSVIINVESKLKHQILPFSESNQSEHSLQLSLSRTFRNTACLIHKDKRCPKTKFYSRKRVEIAVNDAVIVYNDGEYGKRQLFPLLGLRCRHHCQEYRCSRDSDRRENAEKYKTISSKKKRTC